MVKNQVRLQLDLPYNFHGECRIHVDENSLFEKTHVKKLHRDVNAAGHELRVKRSG